MAASTTQVLLRNAIFVFIMQLSGLYLFKEGFLLTRLELENKSPHTAALASGTATGSKDLGGFPRFNKTLLVMIDALRYDFMKWDEEASQSRERPHYLNKLEILERKQRKEPLSSLLVRGLSDPPTTTMQRLVAIMTGALPTLVDAGSNFASSALKEDNLIEKILASGKRVVSLGDDTWDRLFPSSFNESKFFPSFDVWDLHSVDLGVLEHLMPMLDKADHDWGLLIAHFLGVDHAGHRYGPGHVAMGDKLVQMNKVLIEIFEKVHPDTLVVVMGDHGMDAKGDHGGDSLQEMNAGLFFYSKTPFLAPESSKTLLVALDHIAALHPQGDYDIFTRMKGDRTLQQIDLVPTLSALMGLGIPFGNLGTLIPEFFLNHGDYSYSLLLEEMAKNAKQVADYLDVYTIQRPDAKSAFTASRSLYKTAQQAHRSLILHQQNPDRPESESKSESELIQQRQLLVYVEYTKFLRQTLLVARAIWSRFEHVLMAMGCITLFLSLLVSLRMFNADRIKGDDWGWWWLLRFFGVGMVGGVFGGVGRPFRRILYADIVDEGAITLQTRHEALFFAVVGVGVTWLVLSIKSSGLERDKTRDVRVVSGLDSFRIFRLGTVLILLYACTLGSDSFLIFEDFVLLHFCQLLHLVILVDQYIVGEKSRVSSSATATTYPSLSFGIIKTFMCMVVARVVGLVTICRPDQGPYCLPTYNDTPTSSISALWTLAPSLLLCAIICAWVSFRHSLFFTLLFSFDIFAVQAYWMIETLDNHFIPIPALFLNHKNWLATVFWIALIILLVFFSNSHNLLEIGFVSLIMFQKPMGCIVLSLFFLYLVHMRSVGLATPQLFFLMGQMAFFSTGHQNILATIQHDVGFIGLRGADMVLSPIFIALNTFGGPILATLALVSSSSRASSTSSHSQSLGMSFILMAKSNTIIWARHLAVTVFFTWYFCRHSQAFRVWGPKFLFFAATHLCTSIVFIAGLMLRVWEESRVVSKIKVT